MRATRVLSHSLCVFLIFFSTAVFVHSQAVRTWVSGVGDDVNPCSRTAPCKTFAGAISKTAANGEINCLDSGGFGSVTIIKSMTIDCKSTQAGILAASTTGINVNIKSGTDVARTFRLRGLNINGTGTGINGVRVMDAASVYIENTVIDGFTQNGVLVENGKVVISGSTIRNNTLAGVGGTPTADPAEIMVSGSLIAGNGIGVSAGPNATIRLGSNAITANKIGLAAAKNGAIISFKNNAIDGNGTNGAPTSTTPLQ